jgi:Cyclin, N-terminal domain
MLVNGMAATFSSRKNVSFIGVFSRIRSVFDEDRATNGRRNYDPSLIYRMLRTEDKKFLSDYWFDYFFNLRKLEQRSMLEGILDNHPSINRFLRAHLINWMIEACNMIIKDDLTIPFAAISLMDRFYKCTKSPQPAKEIQLTGLTGLFVVSKYFEIQPIMLPTLVSELGY